MLLRTLPSQVEQYNLIVVVGAKDEADNVVTVRTRDDVMTAAVQRALNSVLAMPTGDGLLPASEQAQHQAQQVVLSCHHLVDVCKHLTQTFQ